MNITELERLARVKPAIPVDSATMLKLCEVIRAQHDALRSLMDLEARGRIMPIGIEWDKAREALAKANEVMGGE